MTITSNHRIIGFDPERPPKVETFPCIYLFFQLNEQAPPDWCEELARLVQKAAYPVEMDPEEGTIIRSWVRKPAEIEGQLEKLKVWVAEANAAYDRKVNAPEMVVTETGETVRISPEQQLLNEVVATLNFD